MIYLVDSDYRIMTGGHVLMVKRGDPRNLELEILVPTWRKVQAGEEIADDSLLHFHPQEFQAIMRAFTDAAWRVGIKPTNFQQPDGAAQIAAMDAHLQDMRRLVFEAKP